ncbi:GspH/FimT family pseudopilin [Methylomonas sp. HW2-6]|uniref:GspH/FimT family pseudopilin n=1 Tax=Methylomonas TaxID=416 RepID=UPI00112B2997|nr:GspH/FimT family pseudopilin [Methylomonas koyamae]TPQ28654.1 type II secretion system protein GspH [Methylomonas koyamae]
MAALPASANALRRPPRSCAGFTLIELVVVLLVAVLGFAALGGSIGSGNKSTQLQALARDLASALRYAQGQALATQRQTSVAIDLRNNSYQISNRDKVYTFAEEVDVSLVVAEEEFGADQIGSIRFFGDGSSTGGRITLEWGNQLRRIDVNWITGEVRISDAAA